MLFMLVATWNNKILDYEIETEMARAEYPADYNLKQ